MSKKPANNCATRTRSCDVAVGLACAMLIATIDSNAAASDWSWGPPLEQPQSAFGCAANDAAIFVVGGTYWESTGAGEPRKRWLASAWRLSSADRRWQPLPNFPHPIGYALTTLVEGRLHVIGGRNESGVLQTTYSIAIDDPQASWVRGPSLPRPLCRLRGGYDHGTIYALTDEFATENGGAPRRRSSVLAWQVATAGAQWEERAEGPAEGVGYSAAAVCGGKLFVFGGAMPAGDDELTLLDACWKFDLQRRQWSSCKSMSLALRDATATSIDGRYVAVVGGVMSAAPDNRRASESSPVILSTQSLVYDAQADSFEVTTPLYQAVADHGLAVFDSQAYVIGGEDSIHRTRTNLVQRIALKSFLGNSTSEIRGIRSN